MLSKKSTTTDIKKLLIYETTHFEILSGLLKLSDGHFSEITVFIYDAYYDALQTIIGSEKYSFKLNCICKKEKTNRGFIKYFFSYLRKNKHSHVHISTLDHNLLFFAAHLLFYRNINFSMTVHSINTYRYNKYGTMKDISEAVAKTILHKKIERYRVLAPEMTNHFHKKFPSKSAYFIPGSFYKKTSISTDGNETTFRIVIPGTVSEERRNYDAVVALFRRTIDELTSKKEIHLTLAGNADSEYGKNIIGQLNNIASSNSKFKITSYFSTIDQNVFESIYRSADVILAPLQVNTRSIRNQNEINTVSHSPGFITDEIYMGKPAIIPYTIQTPAEFDDCFWRYKTDDQLNDIISTLLSKPAMLEEKKQMLLRACEHFKVENFITEFKLLLQLK